MRTPGQADALSRVGYRVEVTETPETFTAVLTEVAPPGATPRVLRYQLSRGSYQLRMQLAAPQGAGLVMASGAAFVPAPLPGFGAGFSDVEAVEVSATGQERIDGGETRRYAADSWAGSRSRFWAWLARPAAATVVAVQTPVANQRAVQWRPVSGMVDLVVYAGPIERSALRAVSPDLTQTLFAALWEPLRWLCFGLLFLLDLIMRCSWQPRRGHHPAVAGREDHPLATDAHRRSLAGGRQPHPGTHPAASSPRSGASSVARRRTT